LNQEKKETLINYARKLKKTGLVSIGCNKGSISLREKDLVYMTPSGLDYDQLTHEDITVINNHTKEIIICKHTPSMDTDFHLAIYHARPDVNGIIHTHARYVTALALAGKSLPVITYGAHLQMKEKVKCADFYVPSDPKMNLEIVTKLGRASSVILKNHGAITTGNTLSEAYKNMVFLEETAESYVHAIQIGKVDCLAIQ